MPAQSQANDIPPLWQDQKSNDPQHCSSSRTYMLLSTLWLPFSVNLRWSCLHMCLWATRDSKGTRREGVLLCREPSSVTSCPIDSTSSLALNSDLCLLQSVGQLCSAQILILYATARIFPQTGCWMITGLNSWVSHLSGITLLLYLSPTVWQKLPRVFIVVCGGRVNPHQLLHHG